VDLFATAVTSFIMYSRLPPWNNAVPGDPYYALICKNRSFVFWKAHARGKPEPAKKFFSKEFKDFFTKCVAY